MNHSITQFWYVLEQLIPFDLTKASKDLKHCASILPTEQDKNLPWLNSSVLTKQFKLPTGFDKKGKPIEYNYRVYLGVFCLQSVFEFLQSLPKPVGTGFSDLASSSKNLSCFVSFIINQNGLLVDETLSCSTVPWVLKQVQTVFTSNERLSLDGWTDAYRVHNDHLKRLFSVPAKANTAVGYQVTIADLIALMQILCQTKNQWQPDDFNYLGYYTIQRSGKSDDASTDILNSFYLSDLEDAAKSLKASKISKPLSQYLADIPPQRIPVEERFFLQNWLSPKYIPSGRWPSDPGYNLSLMQQCSVNLTLNQLNKTGGLFSVNGPPGTGKTTLLRDIIADLIVQRAEQLVKHQDPMNGFSNVDGVYRLNPSLTGFEIVVTSSNNGAVENITAELPSLDVIAAQYQEQANYFREIAENVRVKSAEKIDQRRSHHTKNNSQQINELKDRNSQPLGELEEELDVTEQVFNDQTVWGLIAAVLGKKDNCNRFCNGFWFDKDKSIREPLKEKGISKLEAWIAACAVFKQRKKKVLELIKERQSYANVIRRQVELSNEYAAAKGYFDKSEQFLTKTAQIYQHTQRDLLEAKSQMDRQQSYVGTIHLGKPSFIARLFNTSKAQQHQQRMDTAQQEFENCRQQVDKLETNLKQAEIDYHQAKQHFSQAQAEVQEKEQESHHNISVLQNAKSHLSQGFADLTWWNQQHEELQLSAPWIDAELNEARNQLFWAALKVHEQFIRNASQPLMRNLSRWVDMVNGNWRDLTAAQILHLWQTFFLVVPVVSTTFASIKRLFQRLEPESIGWLLIDEAGQGTPQAAVGALQRARQVVVVGDPLQIKPVFTLDPAIVEGLRQYFGVEQHWSPTSSSIQTLCDRANPYGTLIETETEPLWIGCPLWVHRRCVDPMLTLANKIAYNGKIVMATKPPQDKYFPLGESCWIDINGSCLGRHWVPEQGEQVIKLLKQILEAEKTLPSLYIISPFRAVSYEMQILLLRKKTQWARGISGIEDWVKQSVGTVHTFQGKEADSVILILGTDEKSRGAAQWAASEPNILNVAATRAKYRFYIVGSKSLWSRLRYFDSASELLNPKL